MIKWSAPLAYAVGLIATDGYLSSDKRHIVLTSADKQLLDAFLFSLKKDAKISINPPSAISKKTIYRVQISDVTFYKWLENIGLTTKKSLTIGPLQIPDEYFRDFLRGHLDGDGSVVFYKDYYNTKLNPKYIYDRLFVIFRSSSAPHILWLRNLIIDQTGLKGSLSKRRTKTQLGKALLLHLKFSTKEAKKILNWMYYQENLPCLQRKYLVAKPFLLSG